MYAVRIITASLAFLFALQNLSAQQSLESFRTRLYRIHIEELASEEIQELFEETRQGKVYFSNGDEFNHRLNYNLFFDLFYFEDARGRRVFRDPHQIDSIRIDNRIFYYSEEPGYYEAMTSRNGHPLRIRHEIDITTEFVSTAGYGGTQWEGLTAKPQFLVSRNSLDIEDRTIFLENPNERDMRVTLHRQEKFFIPIGGEYIRVENRRNLLSDFDQYSSELRSFVRQESINFTDRNDMLKLADFIGQLQSQ